MVANGGTDDNVGEDLGEEYEAEMIGDYANATVDRVYRANYADHFVVEETSHYGRRHHDVATSGNHGDSAVLAGAEAAMDTTNDTTTTTLSILNDSSFHWEEEILKHARARREKHETSLSRLSIQTNRLEAALSRESKRRVAAVSELERSLEARIGELEAHLASKIDEQHQETLFALSALDARVTDLEARWERQLGDVTSSVEINLRDLAVQLEELQTTVEQAKAVAEERHSSQSDQIRSLREQYDEMWKQERTERLSSLHALTDRIEGQEGMASDHLRGLQSQIGQQLELLAQELQQEASERQAGDDEIVAGLNRYMAQIQKSLEYAIL
jgi:hypothetical protein